MFKIFNEKFSFYLSSYLSVVCIVLLNYVLQPWQAYVSRKHLRKYRMIKLIDIFRLSYNFTTICVFIIIGLIYRISNIYDYIKYK